MPRKRLLWQLYPSYVLITLLSLISISWYFAQALHDYHYRQSVSNLEARARLLKAYLINLIDQEDNHALNSICQTLGRETATRITIVALSGLVIGESDNEPDHMENHANRPEIQSAMNGQTGISTRYSVTLGLDMIYVAIPIMKEGKNIGVIRTSFPLATIEQTLRRFIVGIAMAGFVIALFSAIVSLIISHRISHPLEQLKRGVECYASGHLEHRLFVSGTAEIAALAEAMNQMAAQLDERIRVIQQQRSEHEAILSSMIEGVLAVDQNENIISINQAAATMFEVHPADAQGKKIREVVKNAELHEFALHALSGDQPLEGEIVLHNHVERFLQTHGAALRDAQGNSAGVVIVLNDTTHLRRLEKLRSDFVANVSHELKTPVTSIKGFVETLLDGALDNPHDAKRFLGIIAKQTDRLSAIIEDLLSLSRIEQDSGKIKIHLDEEHVIQVLQLAVENCVEKAKAKQIQIKLDCPDDLTAKINSPLLEQAIVNLIDNAIKYSDAGKSVHVSASVESEEIAIRVSDEGCGIEEEHLDRIFERFYRVDKARSREMGGTGLGLSIVKHIIRTHQGFVTVESAPKIGSVFTIHLPRAVPV
ncbi:MAG: HAMP domain-containing histidine kinase [Candidatus Omnitrophota bacterium]|jgi:two-component system phosphate regulon sensor histidine kinase PhoR|nr:MAG: HAMP domain-containing histidine kinase [Candidatus Omnitrophota bacterium]